MYRTVPVLLLLAALTVGGCQEQAAEPPASPYAGMDQQEIKSLSPNEVDGYLEGEGMGFARVAELNNYPGPRHVLDLSEELDLTEEQRAQIQDIFQEMKARAQALGREYVANERQLDSLFAAGEAATQEVEVLLDRHGALQGRLRFAHVNAHLETTRLLTPAQIRRYNELRGYGRSTDDQHEHMNHEHGE